MHATMLVNTLIYELRDTCNLQTLGRLAYRNGIRVN